MKNTLIVIIILLLVLFIQREWSRPNSTIIEVPKYIYKTDTIKGDSIPYPVYTKLPGDTIRTTDTILINDGSLPDEVWNIITAYYSINRYEDTLINDNDAYLKIQYSLFNNKVQSFNYSFVNKRPVGIVCPEVTLSRNKVFIGGTVTGNMNRFGAGPSVALVTKKDNLYTYNYDIINKTHSVSTFWKLSFRR